MRRENRTIGRSPHRAGLLKVDMPEPSAHGWPAAASQQALPSVDVIGQAISGVDMRVQDDAGVPLPSGAVGEIAVRGHNVMKGYWGAPRGNRGGAGGRLAPHR